MESRLTKICNTRKKKYKTYSAQYALYQCSCGKKKEICENSVKYGATKSCGCLHKEIVKKKQTTHGLSKTKQYRVWYAMMERCYYKKNMYYHNYGGRGIRVCKKWHKFTGFWEDMGGSFVAGLEIDRINNNGNYCKKNCRWVERSVNQNNRRNNRSFTIDGITKNLSQWCRHYGVPRGRVKYRLKKGMDIESALTNPPKKNQFF